MHINNTVKENKIDHEKYIVTRNACKLCTPLGACLAFRGIKGAIPFLHGSQGCATYIRRYMISHFREPMDVASSSFTEASAIFGGRSNLHKGIKNVVTQYSPDLIGIASTCLSETIGDDVNMYLREIRNDEALADTHIVSVSTPSYSGTHAEGFYNTIRETVMQLATDGEPTGAINIIPNMISPADIRYIKEIAADFGLNSIVLPDYSETLDGATWNEYQKIPSGGTPVTDIATMCRSAATIEFLSTFNPDASVGAALQETYGVKKYTMNMPVGIKQSDHFFNILANYAGTDMPEKHAMDRGRLVDAYVDAHKYIFGKKAVLYGEQELVVPMAAFLLEIGMRPVICASGARTGKLESTVRNLLGIEADDIHVMESADFIAIEEKIKELGADILIGSSKANKITRKLDLPLVRIGFPIHDRFGAARTMHLGYRGTQQLFDRIVNAILEDRQKKSPVNYSYI